MSPDRSDSPLVSVGLPLFNQEQHLAATLDRVLAQTHPRLELILVDNASTDQTESICRAYAAREPRVRYYRNRTNLGSQRSFNLTFELCHGEFFIWARGHDIWQPHTIERLLCEMQHDPEVVLTHSRSVIADADGTPQYSLLESLDTRQLSRVDGMCAAWRNLIGPATIGLVRTSAMDRTQRFMDLAGCDILFVLELAALGKIAFVEESLISIRSTHCEASEDETLRRTYRQLNPLRSSRTDPSDKHIFEFCSAHLQIIDDLDLGDWERAQLRSDLIQVYAVKYKGSIERFANRIADRVLEEAEFPVIPGSALTHDAIRSLDYLNFALLFLPDQPKVKDAQCWLMLRATDSLVGIE